jgi:flavoprotein
MQQKKQNVSPTICVQMMCANVADAVFKYTIATAWKPEVHSLIVPMTMRGSGIRDIKAVLGIHQYSAMSVIKEAAEAIPEKPIPTIKITVKTIEMDEFWSFIGSKECRRWTWYARDPREAHSCTPEWSPDKCLVQSTVSKTLGSV